MTSPKFCRNSPGMIDSSGMILADVILAMSLGVVFVALIVQSSLTASQVYETAVDRERAIQEYLGNAATTSTGLYGNERIETNSSVNAGRSEIKFNAVETDMGGDPNFNYFDLAGPPLCAVDFGFVSTSSEHIDVRVIHLPVNATWPLTDLIVRNGIAYVSVDSNSAGDPDLLVFDISDPSRALLYSSLNTGPGIVSLALAGHEIYAAAPSTVGQLQVIHLNDLDHLALEARFRLPLPFATATPTLGSAVYYAHGKIFLGTEKWDGAEFNELDVSNPSAPVFVGGYEVGSKVTNILALKGKVFLATAALRQLIGLDATSLGPLGSLSPSGSERQEGSRINSFEGDLVFGRTSGGYDIPADPEVLRSGSLNNIFSTTTQNLNVPGGVYGVVSDRRHTFLATRTLNQELKITDRALLASTSLAISLPIQPQALTCDSHSLYLLAHNSPTIYEIKFK